MDGGPVGGHVDHGPLALSGGGEAHIEDIFAAQDKVAVRLRFRGTHSGDFPGFGATGRTVEYVSHEFYRIAGGLIAEEWICSEIATLLGQLN